MDKLALRKSLKKDAKLVPRQISYLAHEIAQGNIELMGGEFNHKIFWFLHACAYHYCKQTWLKKLIEKKQIPLLDEEDIKTIKELQEKSKEIDRALIEIDKDSSIVINYYQHGREICEKYSLEELLHFYPFIIIRESEIKKYLGRKWDIKDMVETAKLVPTITLYGKINIFPYQKSKWRPMTLGLSDNLCGVYIAHEKEEYHPLRSNNKLSGHGHKREEVVFILNFRRDWGRAFLLSLLKIRVDTIPPEIYSKLPPNTQMLYFSLIWNDWPVEYGVEAMSFLLELKWPTSNIRKRVKDIDKNLEKMFDILNTIKFKKFFLKRPKKIQIGKIKDTKWLFLKKA